MGDGGTQPPLASRAFDTVVATVGLLPGIWSFVVLAREPDRFSLAALLGVVVVAVLTQFPWLIGREGGIEVGFESCVLIFLACLIDPYMALVVWSLGSLAAQLVNAKRPEVKAFNTGLSILCGAATLAVFGLGRHPENTPGELLVVSIACAVYFATDWVISAISVALENGTSIRPVLVQSGGLAALTVFVGVDSLGYLGALVSRTQPLWAALLLAVPVLTILVAARARSRGEEQARRLHVLFAAAQRAQTIHDRQAALLMVRDAARELVPDRMVELRDHAPAVDEAGAVELPGGCGLWVRRPTALRAGSTAEEDEEALHALVALAEDTFSRLRLVEEMSQLARHDSLTGLANRALLLDRVEHALAVGQRRESQLAVVFCDLDGFKQVNDRFGHSAGDVLLQEVGRRIAGCVRETDTVARLGGDEFAVLIEDVEDFAAVDATCIRILEAVRPSIVVASHPVDLTTSIGVAVSEAETSAAALLRNADMAMYHAKARGRDRYERYHLALLDDRLRRIELVEELRRAIDARSFELHYQPVINMTNGDIVGLESLVRWRRDGRLVPPDVFIQVAEETGLIVALGELVLDLVADAAPMIRAATDRPLSLGVNVSARQLRSPAFAAVVRRTRTAMGHLDLVVEVTEHDFVAEGGQALATMTELAAEDVRFAIDDFGVGFSSIGYLQRLPVRILKIDRSFVSRLDEDDRACELLHSMVLMGKGLGLDVVVEGIERDAQAAHVGGHCEADLAQGFLFGRPKPLAHTLALLTAGSATATVSAPRAAVGVPPLAPAG